jgi:hypothetical protein
MGKEYTLKVPATSQAAVSAALAEHLAPLLRRLDPEASNAFPSVYAVAVPEGLYICDNLTNAAVASSVMRAALDLLLLYAPAVTVAEE